MLPIKYVKTVIYKPEEKKIKFIITLKVQLMIKGNEAKLMSCGLRHFFPVFFFSVGNCTQVQTKPFKFYSAMAKAR